MEYKLFSEIINQRNSYGIEIYKNGKRINVISDLSENRESAEKLVDLLNELKIRENEFDYIIEDYLTFS